MSNHDEQTNPPPPAPKKHRCADCNFCQWCADTRCTACRGTTQQSTPRRGARR